MREFEYASVIKYSSFFLLSLLIVSLAPFTAVGKAAFYLLFLLSLIYVAGNFKSIKNTDKDLKLVFYALTAWFIWTVLTNILNGMPELTQRSLWRRQSFIMALIPLYFLFKAYPISNQWLLKVVIIASLVIFGEGLYEMFYIGIGRLTGGEHPIQYASIALFLMIYLMSVLLFSTQSLRYKYLIIISGLMLLVSIIMTSSRGVWLVIPILVLMWLKQLPYYVSLKNKSIATIVMIAVLGGIYALTPAKHRIDGTFKNLTNYYNSTEVNEASRGTSLGTRFEMWKAAWHIFTEEPVIGVGLGGYKAAAIKYQEKYNYSNSAYDHYHPHNQYLSELANKGLIGLVLFMFFLIMLLRYFYSQFINGTNDNKLYAFTGIQYVIAILVLCLTNATFEAKSMVVAMATLISLMLVLSASVKESD